MFKILKDEVEYYNTYEGGYGVLRVTIKTIWRLLIFPVMLFGKLFEWVYYDDTNQKLDEIHKRFW